MRRNLRAREIAALTWAMVTDADGQVGDVIALENRAAKGTRGRLIPVHPLLREALAALHKTRGDRVRLELAVVYSERGSTMSAATVRLWFYRLYQTLGMTGCTSHSGRRTFITRAARKVSEVGGSVRDVQQLAGHASMQTTQLYIEGDSDTKRKLVHLV